MAVDNAAFISELDDTIPVISDPILEGAAQIRAVKRAVLSSFPNVDNIVNANAATMNAVFDQPNNRFIGEVTMFFGAADAIPEGWAICDGTTVNGVATPDLRDRFIKGFDSRTTEAVGATGGTKDTVDLATNLVVKEHVLVESQIPKHSHGFEASPYGSPTAFTDAGSDLYRMGNNTASEGEAIAPQGAKGTNANQGRVRIKEVGGNLGHSHNIENKENAKLDNQPQYTILIFIMFVGKAVA